uniref:Uncharacterized protein n=1 Tax=Anguilla anguilla TaxID=7936 RepID=A0A0E9TR15_ANGAN
MSFVSHLVCSLRKNRSRQLFLFNVIRIIYTSNFIYHVCSDIFCSINVLLD